MKAEEKALELFNKMYNVDCDDDTDGMQYGHAKKCALIAVEEMIVQNGDIHLAMVGDKVNEYYVKMNSYLFKVKQEIINL